MCLEDEVAVAATQQQRHAPLSQRSRFNPAGVLEGNDREMKNALVLSEELCRNVGETRLGGTGRSSWGGVVER